ncbi:hypothetical protein PV381_42665 [Streptomyces scabiei]|uniref:hypothetical protein n=1 Tax=Streptomyces scabiei TaxID=1930 RepID=UPI0029B6EBA7|nr:hypothetical protein [Streptomyces scabiei]MDX2633188.1 hypothetical protein [Streptomyces scabiei]
MNDEDTPDAEDGEEDFDQEAEPRQDVGADIDLSGLMKSARQNAAWLNSIDKQFEAIRRQLRGIESTRRSIVDAMGPANAVYQAALDAQRRYQAIAVPVLALQSDLSDIYDWHSRIDDVVRSVSLPRTLLDQLAATAALFLPANLSGLDTEDLYTILDWARTTGCPSRGRHGPRSSKPCSPSAPARSATPSLPSAGTTFSTTSTPASRSSPTPSSPAWSPF